MATDGTLEILIDIRARLDDMTKAQRGMQDATNAANSLGQALKTGLGIDLARRGVELITRSFQESVVAALEMAGAIKDQSENLQMSTEAYQVLGQVLTDAGGSMELLTQMVSTNNRSLAEARNITSGAAAAYRQLGLDSAKLESLPVEERMVEIGKAVLGAKDQTLAFGAASQVLGSRNLPTMLGALKTVSSEGYDALAKAAKAAGLVMENETVTALDRAQKQIEKFKRALAISTGAAIGEALKTDPSLIPDVTKTLLGGAGAFFGAGRSAGAYMGNVVNAWSGLPTSDYAEVAAKEAKATEQAEQAAAARERAAREQQAAAASAAQRQQTELANAEMYLKMAQGAAQVSAANPFSTDDEKRKSRIFWLNEEIARRRDLYALLQKAPLGTESTQQRSLKLDEQTNAIESATRERDALERGTSRYGGSLRYRQAKETAVNREDASANSGYVPMGEAAQTGALDWANSLGSQGEQVAGAIQSTIGATVQSISEGIYGWITGTESFSDVLLNLGATVLQTVLQTIVQMGVQWVISAALAKTSMLGISALGFGIRKAETADVIANETAKSPAIMANAAGSSVSSFGLAAILGIAALVAAMALFGGFAQGGYTGAGAIDQPAGVVHAGEVVFSQRDVAAFGGAAALDNLRVAGPDGLQPTASASGSGSVASHVMNAFLAQSGQNAAAQKRERDVVVVGSMLEARNLQRDPEWESFVVDVAQRRKADIFG